MFINIILYQAVFLIYLHFCFDSYTFIFLLYSTDTTSVNVRMSYRFSASLLWMLKSLFFLQSTKEQFYTYKRGTFKYLFG